MEQALRSTHDISVTPITGVDYTDTVYHPMFCFDWATIHADLAEALGEDPEDLHLKVFVFRSLQKASNSDQVRQRLADVDAAAYAAAREVDGTGAGQQFLRYFAGEVRSARSLSFCIWRSIEAAQEAVRSEAHGEAAQMLQIAYQRAETEWFDLGPNRSLGQAALTGIEGSRRVFEAA